MVKKCVLKKVLNESKKKINEIYSMKNNLINVCFYSTICLITNSTLEILFSQHAVNDILF